MDGTITIGTELDTKKFDRQIQHLEAELEQMEKSYTTGKKLGFKEDEDDLKKLEVEIERTRNKLVGLYKQKMQLNTPKTIKESNNAIKGLNSSLDKSVKKAGKLALAIFGVRSAYMYLRRASSELASYDEGYAANLEYIQFALTQAIAPVLKYIVELAGTLLAYINAIAQAWFGVNLFANGSVEAFNKMKKGAAGVGKEVKEIKKQLLGFDEINMLTDQSDTGTRAGAGGVGIPSFDLGQDIEIPEWLEFIIDHKEELVEMGSLKAFLGILDELNIPKIGGIQALADTIEMLDKKGIPAIGSLKGISEMINLITKEGLQGTGALEALKGIIDKIGVGGVGSLKNLSEVIDTSATRSIKSLADAEKDLKKATESLLDAQDKYIDCVDRLTNAQERLEEAERKTNLSGEELYESVQQGTLDYQEMTTQQREVYKAYLDTQKAQENLDKATQNLTEAKRKEKVASLENQLALANEKKEFGEYKNAVVEAFKKGEISSEDARILINKSMSGMSKDVKQTFTEDLPTDIKSGLSTDQYENKLNNLRTVFTGAFGEIGTEVGDTLGSSIGEALKSALNYALSILEWKINSVVNIINTFTSRLSSNPLLSGVVGWIGRIPTVSLPRLAVGGIVNMPNTGTLVGGAIAGESGKEGVIPLTDRQTMAELGREIGRWITVNANITNTMNGRVISRELKQIQNEQDFVYNT